MRWGEILVSSPLWSKAKAQRHNTIHFGLAATSFLHTHKGKKRRLSPRNAAYTMHHVILHDNRYHILLYTTIHGNIKLITLPTIKNECFFWGNVWNQMLNMELVNDKLFYLLWSVWLTTCICRIKLPWTGGGVGGTDRSKIIGNWIHVILVYLCTWHLRIECFFKSHFARNLARAVELRE